MKKFIYALAYLTIAFLFILGSTIRAQSNTVIKTWDFESSMENWVSGGEGSSIELSTDQAHNGTQSLKLVQPNTSTEINLQNDSYKPQEGDSLVYWIYISAADLASAGGIQIFWQAGDGWSWHSTWINGTDVTGDAWYRVSTALTPIESPLQRIGLQFTGNTGTEANTPTMYVDDITVTRLVDTTLVSNWGSTSRGNGWPILNTSSTSAGDGGMGAAGPPPSWATIRGEFSPIDIALGETIVITGQFEYVGAGPGPSYVGLRYALTFQDSTTLQYQNTDSAAWVSSKGHYGYEFTPRSDGSDYANGTGGSGTIWTINGGGGWNSTYSNNGLPFGTVAQAPRLAEIAGGVYDFAISVQSLTDSTNEIRWFMFHEDQLSYWFGGTAIDTSKVSTKFNGICFGVGDGITTAMSEFNLMGVKVDKGAPIEVPAPPFEPFWVSDWGATSRGTGWPILNDSTTLVGDAGMGSSGPPPSWATIRGSFGLPVEATMDEAIIITGQFEYVGAGPGPSYVGLRYALTNQPDEGTLDNQYTDSAYWSGTGAHYGYEFTPRSDGSDFANGTGGSGTIWTVNGGGGWNSTYSNNGLPFGTVAQAPRLAEIAGGKYDFAISVQPLGNGTNEIRWSMFHTDKQSYWFGGTAIDTSQVTTKFNGICFGVGDGITTSMTAFNLIAVRVDRGDPIDVPAPPFEPFWVSDWGATNRGTGWPILNDSTTLVGDAGMGAAGPPPSWATIRGGFGLPVEATMDEAIVITGQFEYVGAGPGASYVPLRYALTYQPDEGTLDNQYTDSAYWSGTGGHYGYEFTPRSDGSDIANGTGGSGTIWTINGGGGWNSTYSNNGLPFKTVEQVPRLAEIEVGKYDFAISVQPLGNGTNEVRWFMFHEDKESYWFGGTAIDTAQVTTQFNGICFGVGDGITTAMSEFKLIGVRVDRGDPIVVPPPPFYPFYIAIDNWGFYGDPATKIGGWSLTPGTLSGNVSISGSGPVATDQWSSVRGGFDLPISLSALPADTSLEITGKLQFVGGGFDGMTGLLFGLFYSDSAGTVDSTAEYGQKWTGTDAYSSGYLFAPNSGTNDNPDWGSSGKGSIGGVVNSTWLSTNGADNYILSNQQTSDVSGSGTYDFKLNIQDIGSGITALAYSIIGPSYSFAGTVYDSNDPLATTKLNAINFAVSGTNTSTTGLNLTDVYVSLGAPIPNDVDNGKNTLPTVYSLSQNYPNPFNPTTTIEFALPKGGDVTLAVYDILGRKVAELVNGNLNAGYHKYNFNASQLASGVYFYRIEAGDFVSVKKLMLLK